MVRWKQNQGLIFLIGTSLLLHACGGKGGSLLGSSATNNLLQTTSGVKYQFYQKNQEKRAIQQGDLVTFRLVVQNNLDSVLSDQTFREYPVQDQGILIDKPYFKEVFEMLHEGDSLSFWINADSLTAKSGYLNIPQIEEGSDIHYTLKVHKVESKAEIKAKLQENLKVQREIDQQLIQQYLDKMREADSTTRVVSTESGLHYIIHKEGNGAQPEQGDTVTVNYTSKLLSGVIYNQSDGATEFVVGSLIPRGLDEGLTMMKKGGVGTFILPSELGYGNKGMSNVVPPQAVLIFDVELLEVN